MGSLLRRVAREDLLDRALIGELQADSEIADRLASATIMYSRLMTWSAWIGLALTPWPVILYINGSAFKAPVAWCFAIACALAIPVGYLLDQRVERWIQALAVLEGERALSAQARLLSFFADPLNFGHQMEAYRLGPLVDQLIVNLDRCGAVEDRGERALHKLLPLARTPRATTDKGSRLESAIVRFGERSGSTRLR